MEVRIQVKINASDLYDYMMRHQYTSASGVIGSGVGGILTVCGLFLKEWAFVLAGLVVLLYLPVTLFLKSRQQIKFNKAFAQEMTYILNEEGLTVQVGEESGSCPWEQIVKAVSTTRSIFLYTSSINATIIPKRFLNDKKEDVIRVICTHMPPRKVKIKE